MMIIIFSFYYINDYIVAEKKKMMGKFVQVDSAADTIAEAEAEEKIESLKEKEELKEAGEKERRERKEQLALLENPVKVTFYTEPECKGDEFDSKDM